MNLHLEDLIERRIYYTGRYENLIETLLCKGLRKGGTFIDVGANTGYYSLLAACLIGEQGIVYSLEPFPETFRRLQHNICLNAFSKRIILRQLAVSNKQSEAVSLFLRGGEPALVSMSHFACTSNVEEVKVKCDTLDNVLGKHVGTIDFVKIDVEGAEVLVLQGMSGLLAKDHCTNIVIETHMPQIRALGFAPEDIADFLTRYGYRLLTKEKGFLVDIDLKDFFNSDEGHRFILATHDDNWKNIRIPTDHF
jgi:FkbM family methyltransferase